MLSTLTLIIFAACLLSFIPVDSCRLTTAGSGMLLSQELPSSPSPLSEEKEEKEEQMEEEMELLKTQIVFLQDEKLKKLNKVHD